VPGVWVAVVTVGGGVEAVDGMEMRTWDMPWHTSEGVTKLPSNTWVVTGRLRQRERLAAGEAYVRSLSSAPVRVTLIAPRLPRGQVLEERGDGPGLRFA
jgi:hypothetical protein